jgi:hypothetical protein
MVVDLVAYVSSTSLCKTSTYLEHDVSGFFVKASGFCQRHVHRRPTAEVSDGDDCFPLCLFVDSCVCSVVFVNDCLSTSVPFCCASSDPELFPVPRSPRRRYGGTRDIIMISNALLNAIVVCHSHFLSHVPLLL